MSQFCLFPLQTFLLCRNTISLGPVSYWELTSSATVSRAVGVNLCPSSELTASSWSARLVIYSLQEQKLWIFFHFLSSQVDVFVFFIRRLRRTLNKRFPVKCNHNESLSWAHTPRLEETTERAQIRLSRLWDHFTWTLWLSDRHRHS